MVMSLVVDIIQDTILVLRKLNTNIVCDENVILVQTRLSTSDKLYYIFYSYKINHSEYYIKGFKHIYFILLYFQKN